MRLLAAIRSLIVGTSLGFMALTSTAAPPTEYRVFSPATGVYPHYRIPALAIANNGDILAFAEGRQTLSDLGDIDIVMRRSLNQGITWEDESIVLDDSGGNISNPVPIVDGITVHLLFCRGASNDFVGSKPDRKSVWHMKSGNHGRDAWSRPTLLFDQSMVEGIDHIAVGPGHGLRLENGRLLAPAYLFMLNGDRYNFAIFSDDHGASWNRGDLIKGRGVNECLMAELSDGSIVINSRDQSGGGRRMSAVSRDRGKTFSAFEYEPELLSPVCQGSVIHWKARPERLVYAGPHHRRERRDLRLMISQDGGQSWRQSKLLLPGPLQGGYSDMAAPTANDLAILHERQGSEIWLFRVSWSWLNRVWIDTNFSDLQAWTRLKGGLEPTVREGRLALKAPNLTRSGLTQPFNAGQSYSVEFDTRLEGATIADRGVLAVEISDGRRRLSIGRQKDGVYAVTDKSDGRWERVHAMSASSAGKDMNIRVMVNDGIAQLFVQISEDWTWVGSWVSPANKGQAEITLFCEGEGLAQPVSGSFSYLRVY